MTEHKTIWTDHEEKVLARLSDQLIPGGAGMPAASEAETISGTERISTIRPDLLAPTKELIRELDSHQEWSVEEMRTHQPERFLAAAELLAGAYLLDERVAQSLDYLDRPTIPLDQEPARTTELQELVSPVIARGNVWRTTP